MWFLSWRRWKKWVCSGRSKRSICLKTVFSVPGLTLKYLFLHLSPQTYFSLCDKANSDLYNLIRITIQAAQVSFSSAAIKASKTKIREEEEGPAAKLCKRKKKSWDMTLMRCTFGLWCRVCQRGAIQEGWRKTSLNPKVLYAWQSSGWGGWLTRNEFILGINWITPRSVSMNVNCQWMVSTRRRKLCINSTGVTGTAMTVGLTAEKWFSVS